MQGITITAEQVLNSIARKWSKLHSTTSIIEEVNVVEIDKEINIESEEK